VLLDQRLHLVVCKTVLFTEIAYFARIAGGDATAVAGGIAHLWLLGFRGHERTTRLGNAAPRRALYPPERPFLPAYSDRASTTSAEASCCEPLVVERSRAPPVSGGRAARPQLRYV